MIARSAPSPSSPAPSARRCAALGPDCSARPSKRGDRAANAYLTTLASTEDTRSSDSVRQVEYWFPQIMHLRGLSTLLRPYAGRAISVVLDANSLTLV